MVPQLQLPPLTISSISALRRAKRWQIVRTIKRSKAIAETSQTPTNQADVGRRTICRMMSNWTLAVLLRRRFFYGTHSRMNCGDIGLPQEFESIGMA